MWGGQALKRRVEEVGERAGVSLTAPLSEQGHASVLLSWSPAVLPALKVGKEASVLLRH